MKSENNYKASLKSNKYLSKFRIIFAALPIMIIFLLTGCGANNEELDTYKTNMNSFFDKASAYDSAINSIDASSDSAVPDLLSNLDGLNECFQEMAAYDIPSEFDSLSDLATESAEYMQQANDSYHAAYDGEYDADSEALASQYYERANSRVKYMITILHGEVPEGEGIKITTEDTYNFTTITEDSSTEASTTEENDSSEN